MAGPTASFAASVDYSLTVTSPNGLHSIEALPTWIELSGSKGEPSALIAEFEYGWDWYRDEDNPDNPIQLQSYIILYRDGVVVFRGYIYSRRLVQGGIGGEQIFEITCLDPIGKLKYCLAVLDGDPLFTRQSQHVDITETPLLQADPIGDSLFPFFPQPSAGDPWLPVKYTNNTLLDETIDNAVTTIVATVENAGMLPLGLILIDNEWIQYDGYDYTSVSLKYRFKGCVRGVLGTAPAAHIGGASIYQMISQKIHPVQPILIEGWNTKLDTPAWEPVNTNSYAVQPEEGRYDFTYDILNHPAGDTKYNALRATYAVFDEDITIIGTVTSFVPSTTILVDMWATFETNGITAGDGIVLDVGGETATVVSVDSEFQLTTTALSLGGTYDFDEDYTITKASIITLADILTAVLTEPVINGGPGFTAGEISVDTLIDILLTRIRLEETTNCLDFIKNLLDELGLASGKGEDMILLYYDHANGKVVIAPVAQKETPDLHYNNMPLIDEDLTIEDVYSACLIEYTSGQNVNLVAPERFWHPSQNNEDVGDNNKKVVDGRSVATGGGEFGDWKAVDLTGINNSEFTARLTDGDQTSGFGVRFGNADPGAKADCFYAWFNDALDLFTIDEVSVIVDARKESSGVSPYHFKVLGVNFTDGPWILNPQAVPEANKIGLSGALDLRFEAGGTMSFNKVEVTASDIGIKAQGIVLRWNGMSIDSSDRRYALVKEITVKGHLTKTVLVQLTDDDSLGSKFLYAPLSFAKMIDDTLGQPKVQVLKIGQATYNSAVSLGRLAVLQGLFYKASKLYDVRSFHPGSCVPTIGQTAKFQDGTSGVVLNYSFRVEGSEFLSVRVLDFTSILV